MEYCTECQCVSTEYGDVISNALVGNGICNDETNTVNCGFDAFDCCLSNVTDHHCSECSCHSKCIFLSPQGRQLEFLKIEMSSSCLFFGVLAYKANLTFFFDAIL